MEKVIVFGSFVVDLMARADRLPKAGETVRGNFFKMGPGGKGFNQAVACHMAGGEAMTVIKLGKDEFSKLATNLMDKIDMNTDYVLYSDDKPTGVALIPVDEVSGENQIMIVPGASESISSEEVYKLEDVIEDASYILLQYEVNQDANELIKKIALEKSKKVIVNTAPYVDVDRKFYEGLYLVTPNESEAESITGVKVNDLESCRKASRLIKDMGVQNVIITLGKEGVFVDSDGKSEIIPSYKVKAVDTTGAGDAFNGGLLAALSEGKDIFSAAKFANATAGLAVTKMGTSVAMPTRVEIDQFIQRMDHAN